MSCGIRALDYRQIHWKIKYLDTKTRQLHLTDLQYACECCLVSSHIHTLARDSIELIDTGRER